MTELTLLTIVIVMMVFATIYCVSVSQGKKKYLCEDCRFNDPEKCLKVERPKAILCTSYRLDTDPISQSQFKQ